MHVRNKNIRSGGIYDELEKITRYVSVSAIANNLCNINGATKNEPVRIDKTTSVRDIINKFCK
jgi:hypothetical protein